MVTHAANYFTFTCNNSSAAIVDRGATTTPPFAIGHSSSIDSSLSSSVDCRFWYRSSFYSLSWFFIIWPSREPCHRSITKKPFATGPLLSIKSVLASSVDCRFWKITSSPSRVSFRRRSVHCWRRWWIDHFDIFIKFPLLTSEHIISICLISVDRIIVDVVGGLLISRYCSSFLSDRADFQPCEIVLN